MSLAEQFQKEMEDAPKRSPFQGWVDSLPEKDRAAVYEYAANQNMTTSAFFRVVKAAGARVGKDYLQSWRQAQGYVPR